MLLQDFVRPANLMAGVTRSVALTVVAFVVAALVAVLYRWYFKERIPRGLSTLFGVATVALYLNTVGLLGQVIGTPTGGDPFDTSGVVFNLLTLFIAGLVTLPGRRAGDSLMSDIAAVSGVRELDRTVGTAVRKVGRVISVELPTAEEIEDIVSHDPVPAAVKGELGGKTLLFPRKDAAAIRDRLVTRIKEDYDVGYVDVELNADGDVTYLAVGSRIAGLGPTMGPGTCAVAIEADPVSDASPGDIVQVWTTGGPESPSPTEVASVPDAEQPAETAVAAAEPTPRRVAAAEVRAVAGDTVTLALDGADAESLLPDERYRLLTLPVTARADREFASLLRAADETFGVVSLPAESSLAGVTIGDLDATVVAVRRADGALDTIPDRDRRLAGGETVYALGRPDVLRGLEARAKGEPPEG